MKPIIARRSFQAPGLILPTEIIVERWHRDGSPSQKLKAHVYIDTGAEDTLVNLEWLMRHQSPTCSTPPVRINNLWRFDLHQAGIRLRVPDGWLSFPPEGVFLADRRFPAGLDRPRHWPAWLPFPGEDPAGQVDAAWLEEQGPAFRMPSDDDLLLGLNFLQHNRLVLEVDGLQQHFSLHQHP